MSLAFTEGISRSELAEYRAIDMRCDDCGRTKRMQSGEIVGHARAGVRSLVALGNKLHCSLCRDRGGLGRNISLFPIYRRC